MMLEHRLGESALGLPIPGGPPLEDCCGGFAVVARAEPDAAGIAAHRQQSNRELCDRPREEF
jgi:hypothetical protein